MKSFLIFCILAIAAPCFAGDSGYHIIKRLKVGGEGGWDYLTADTPARRLYISRSTHVMVIDLDTDQVVGDIPDTPGVHGIAVAPEFNRGYTSNGKADTATIFDLKTLKVLGTVKTGENPDAILYDPASKKVFTFNGKSKDATVIGAVSGKVVKTIPIGGKPEYAVTNGKGKVYVNIEDTNELVEIDSLNTRLSQRWSLKPCQEPTGMGLDAEHNRVFSGCHNKIMTIFDINAQKVIAQMPIGEKVDGNGFDPATGLAFSANGDGTLTVVRESSPGKFEVVDNVATQRGSRTMAIDAKTHHIYLPGAQFAQPTEPVPAGAKQRPVMVKGSFEVLVVGK
ncbi:MAG: YncE family protein [Deltaproteobacteria bacterium]|nr:YncE family protein [Deltaproteobacteria bacterium]MBF0525116.1 YncE family protein [Deltaproteobacteria bacterium]